LINRFGKHAFYKAALCGFVLLLGCTLDLRADPFFTPTVLISLAISAALSAASIGLQLLFQPKPKPQDKNKLQGDVRLTTVGEDIPIPEPYGASLGDGQGGFRLGGIIFYMSQIRDVPVTIPGNSGGGGGKGAPRSTTSAKEHHYFVDIALMVGRGPLRVKQVKANTDILYQDFSQPNQLSGTTYEAELYTSKSAGAGTGADTDFSNLQKATLPNNEWVQWNNVVASVTDPVEVYIAYKSTQDVEIDVTVNGTVHAAVLPDSFGLVASINLPQSLTIGSSNTIRITNKTAGYTLALDRIVAGTGEIITFPGDPGDGGCYLSGLQYQGYTNPEPTYDYQILRDPLVPDPRGCNEFNYQANRNSRGEVEAMLTGGSGLRWYPGNKTQLPDPMLQAYFEGIYGAGSTPAFRNRCYLVLENFEVTKYGTIPNFTFVVEHETVNSVGELFAARALRAGLDTSEFDFTELDAAPLRGYCITNKQAPAREMELLCRVYDVDVYEDFDGVIRGVVPSETVVAAIPADELAAEENKTGADDSGDAKPFAPFTTTFRDERDLPFFLDASFFDPTKDFEARNVHSLREIGATSDRKENIETGVVFTETEAQKFVDRELHKLYVEKDGLKASLFHKYTWLTPTDKISVEDVDGSVNNMRIKAIDGWLPGVLDVRGVSRDAVEYPPRLFVVANTNPAIDPVSPPAPLVGTFIDLALFDEQANPGFYVAAAATDPHYMWAGASLYRLGATSEWEALTGIPIQAVMGRTIAGASGLLGDVPGGWAAGDWDNTNAVTIDLYNGELESLTDAQVLDDKRNFLVVGDEVIQFGTATLVGGFPNRWTVSHLQRQLSGTASTGHASQERAVLYTGAWRYVEQDPNIGGTTRTYKFVGAGGDINTASSVDFNWQGRTLYNQPIYNSVDNGIPVLDTDVPIIGTEGSQLHVFIHRPIVNGFSADRAEIRVRKGSDNSELRHIDIGNSIDGLVLTPLDDSKVDYRWQNKYRLFGSDGWSAWSAYATFTAASPPPQPPVITVDPGDPGDPGDVNPVCFIDGTEVLMADWTVKAIETIAAGDYVMAWGAGGRLMPASVKASRRETVPAYRSLELKADRLGVTEYHPFCADWRVKVRVKDMEAGQQIRAWAKGWDFEEIVSNEIVTPDGGVAVNNFEVDVWHTYLVRGPGATSWKAVFNRKSET
jgi:hypothetical protein